jgi:hypothetical protein
MYVQIHDNLVTSFPIDKDQRPKVGSFPQCRANVKNINLIDELNPNKVSAKLG